MTNYEIAKPIIDGQDVPQALERGIISLQIYMFVKRYERYRMYRKVFEQMQAIDKAATDMKCSTNTIRRAIDWCEID